MFMGCATLVWGQSQIIISDTAADQPLGPGEEEIIIESTDVQPLVTQPATAKTNSPALSLTIKDLPPNVRNTIQSHGGQVDSIVTRNVNGRTVYQIKFRETARLKNELYVAQDGLVIREPAGASTEQTAQAPAAIGSSALALSDVPPAVQDVIRAQAGGARLRISQKQVNGRTAFDVQFARDGGIRSLQIADDGAILEEK